MNSMLKGLLSKSSSKEFEDVGPSSVLGESHNVRKYSASFIDTALSSALSGIKKSDKEEDFKGDDEEVLLPNTGFSSIACCPGSIARIYWCDEGDGTIGSYVPNTGKSSVNNK
jgi:hypothetical protein